MEEKEKIEVLQRLIETLNTNVRMRLDAHDSPYDINSQINKIAIMITEIIGNNQTTQGE